MNVGSTKSQNIKLKRLVVFILILATSYPYVLAQDNVLDTRINVRFSNVKLSTVLNSISRKTDYSFTYDTWLVQPGRNVSINVNNMQVREVLDELFLDRPINYSVIGDHIILYKAIDEDTPVITEPGRESVYSINGIITEKGTGEPLPYATIGVKSKGLGTISNYEGHFTLKITENCLNDSIYVSYLGFSSRQIPVSQAIGIYIDIELNREYVSIAEVIIRNREPLDLIRNLKRNIEDNYGSTAASVTAFYRESVSKKNKMLQYSEAVLNIYKSPYTRTTHSDQISILKSRKIENINSSDTLIVKLQAGLDAILVLDGIKNTYDFLKDDFLEDYDYHMVDIVNIGDEAAYVIEFEQKEYITDIALLKGSFYINTDNYGLHAAEFEINENFIHKIEQQIVLQNPKSFSIKPRRIKYLVNYAYENGRFYLNHVRGDLELYARKKRKLFGSTYNVFFEMAVTSIDTVNVSRFSKEDRTPAHIILSESIGNYDHEFWGTDNTLRPENDIEQALVMVKARLSQYKKE